MSGLSNYLVNKYPQFYGGMQEDYQARSNQVIDAGVKMIQEAVEGKKDLQGLFRDLLGFYQQKRGEIARDHGTQDAEAFGMTRLTKSRSNGFYSTPLSNAYEAYNVIYLNQLMGIIKPGEKKWTLEDKAFGRKSCFEVEILSAAEAYSYIGMGGEEVLRKLLGTQKGYLEILADQDLMRRLKEKHIEVYKSVHFNALLSDYINRYPGQLKKNIVFGTLRLEMEGKMYAFSRYLSTFTYNPREAPVESIKKSPSLIAHQDIFLSDKTAQEVGALFAQAVQCDRNDLAGLKDRVKLFRMYFSHWTPSVRGDGAIGDWLELTLYRYHQYVHTHFQDSFLPCFESLASITFSRYAAQYEKIVNVI